MLGRSYWHTLTQTFVKDCLRYGRRSANSYLSAHIKHCLQRRLQLLSPVRMLDLL